ncbi:hypothetical protein [Mycoplasmopsis caviae]|uniref:hypothetical protein n=1 Tax=Mycoplasmopsis caviae TaxID=55603 RepID=UPI001F1CBEC6|nr:hypothetical protein [Mycoplasmopsis caviae]
MHLLRLVVKFNTPTWYVFVIFQLIAIVVYVIQIYFYYYYKNRTSKQQETNVEKQN